MISSNQANSRDRSANDSIAIARDLEPLYDAFESAWRSDERPVLADYLIRAPKPLQPRVFAHLLALDLSYRRDLGERPGIKGYRSAFPEYDDVIHEVFESGYVHSAKLRNEVFETKIGDYTILRRLGAGGQAEVFLAKHETTDEKVVLKVARHIRLDSKREHSLVNEGRILNKLEHPMLARVQQIGFHEGRPFLVMDYENGRSLNKGVGNARLIAEKAVKIVLEVAEAVAAAHEKGIVHLDIKPGNVLLREDGSACLIDFGLAQMALASDPDTEGRCSVVGTPAFMSPEQAAGDWSQIGPQSDVFGLGALLYWFLTGLAPFHGSTFTSCMECATRGDIDKEYLLSWGFPRDLTNICLRAMAPDPADRFQSVDGFSITLRRFFKRHRIRKRCAAKFAVVRDFFFSPLNDFVQWVLNPDLWPPFGAFLFYLYAIAISLGLFMFLAWLTKTEDTARLMQ